MIRHARPDGWIGGAAVPPVCRTRRGFAMAFVLLLALISSLVISATLTRQDAQGRMVQRQVRDYQDHHDMLGVRSIVELWMSHADAVDLVEMAHSEGVDHTFIIEGVMKIAVTVADGQGTPVADAALAPTSIRPAYRAILDRLPEDRRGLVRPRGAPMISPNAAPRAVLEALLEDDGEDFADDVIHERERGPIDADAFFRIVTAHTDQADIQTALRQIVTFEPSVWRLTLELTDQKGERRTFGMIAEKQPNVGVDVQEWLSEADMRLRGWDADKADNTPANQTRPARRRPGSRRSP